MHYQYSHSPVACPCWATLAQWGQMAVERRLVAVANRTPADWVGVRVRHFRPELNYPAGANPLNWQFQYFPTAPPPPRSC